MTLELSSISNATDSFTDSISIFAYNKPIVDGHHNYTPDRHTKHRRTMSFSPNFFIYIPDKHAKSEQISNTPNKL